MAESKPFASLSSGLLARKGGAKPAMRPQGFNNFGANLDHFGSNLEDLGWNDMGHAPEPAPEHVPSSIEALTPAPISRPAEPPVVVEQQRNLEASFAPEVEERQSSAEADPAPRAEVVSLPRSRATAAKAKAAFTLRLDPQRHLKLRLACAVTRRSAQQLVTEALDDFLDSLPEVEQLATHVPAEMGKRQSGVGK